MRQCSRNIFSHQCVPFADVRQYYIKNEPCIIVIWYGIIQSESVFGGNMPVIKESTDFKNSYYDISDFCHKFNEPIIITKNGENDLAVMNIEIYEKITGIRNLINLLEEADNDIESGNFLTEEEMNKKLDLL